MYSSPLFDDTLIDFAVKDKDEILCSGRGRRRHLERVPRLPHTVFMIKKQIEEEELQAGKRKRGRGRASIFKSRSQQNDTSSFRPRSPNIVDSGRDSALQDSVPTLTQAEINGHFDMDGYGGLAEHETVLEDFPVLKGESHSTGYAQTDSNDSKDQLKALKREQEREHHKVNFAEINRQMLSELASSFTNNKAYHKPLRLLSLTKANLDKHMKDSEDVLKMSEAINNARSSVYEDTKAPIYEQYGVTHEDIWLYRQNRFKMPQNVKDKVNKHFCSKIAKMADDVDVGAVLDEKEMFVDDTIDKVEMSVNVETEHEKQVNYLTQLYGEDSWSNQKELSVKSFEEMKDEDTGNNDVQGAEDTANIDYNGIGDTGPEESVVDIDNVVPIEECIEKHEYSNADKSNNATAKLNGSVSQNPCFTEEQQPTNINFDGLSLNATYSFSDSLGSDDLSCSDDYDVNITVKHVENGDHLNQSASGITVENNITCDMSSQCIADIAKEAIENNSDNVTSTSSNCIINAQIESTDNENSDMSNSKDTHLATNTNVNLSNESSDYKSDNDPLVTEIADEKKNQPVYTESNKKKSTTALLDEIDIPFNIKTPVNGEEGMDIDNDLEGFQVVKKKGSKKKKSVSPKLSLSKIKREPDNIIWKLYGKNVIQVDGLPPCYDINSLYSMVCGFGNIKDFQIRNVDGVCSTRFRLPDEDSCDYAVLCLDNTEIFSDETSHILSCFKLNN